MSDISIILEPSSYPTPLSQSREAKVETMFQESCRLISRNSKIQLKASASEIRYESGIPQRGWIVYHEGGRLSFFFRVPETNIPMPVPNAVVMELVPIPSEEFRAHLYIESIACKGGTVGQLVRMCLNYIQDHP